MTKIKKNKVKNIGATPPNSRGASGFSDENLTTTTAAATTITESATTTIINHKKKQKQQQQQQQSEKQEEEETLVCEDDVDNSSNEETEGEEEEETTTNNSDSKTILGEKMLIFVGVVESLLCILESILIMLFMEATILLIKQVSHQFGELLTKGIYTNNTDSFKNENNNNTSNTNNNSNTSATSSVLISTNNTLPILFITHTIYLLIRFKYLFAHINDLPQWFGLKGNNNSNNNKFKRNTKLLSKNAIQFMSSLTVVALGTVLIQYFSNNWVYNLNNYYNADTNTLNYSMIILFSILAPISEEILFRGIIFYIFRRRSNNLKLCIILTNCIFGLYHLVNLSNSSISSFYIIVQILMGVLFGMNLSIFFLESKSLYTPIIIHIFNNVMASFLPTSTSDFTNPILMFDLVLEFILLIVFYNKNIKKVQ